MVRQFLSTVPLAFGDSTQFVSELITCGMWATRLSLSAFIRHKNLMVKWA